MPIVDVTKQCKNPIKCFVDAAGNSSLGWGAWLPAIELWIYRQWEMEIFYQYNSFFGSFELYSLLAWVVTWTPFLTDKVVLFYLDNTSSVYALHNKASDSNPMMFLLCYITLFCMTHNINILAKHIRSKDSIISDLLH